ncbi:GNAT family N-acetyltransferase [Pararhizobium mangrovi]|uniref:GNAT family N-acetyltransferase n=1 Tax=Pararhizobium mangrovi TaxID=2590452 RepID=A0A506U9B9_9HYPH|nr:GNAT family N-acetyltransferase [Pararhizobium mangrovi]TPW29555.1 GNAT family N-acetyltransferase [Pararhizobium mangrovi]
MNRIDVRAAVPTDAGTILTFVRELAAFEHAGHEVVATEAAVRESIFAEGSHVEALIAEIGGEPAGFAVYFYNYSTWQGRKGLYLEDLYVSPERRGLGAGKALLKRLAAIARDNACGRFEWSVLDWNSEAMAVYDSVGARPQNEWIRYRIEGDALERLAADG